MSRDVVALILKSPWWVVVGLVAGGAMWASDIQGEVGQIKQQVTPLVEVRRQLDSLRIEQRHMSDAVNEIRALLGRRLTRDNNPRQPFWGE